MRARPSLLYAQSGGMTAVINASAAGVLHAAQQHDIRVLAAVNGVLGMLEEELLDVSRVSKRHIELLRQTPGGAFGSSRFPLGTPESKPAHYRRLIDVMAAHEVRWLLHNGGGGSAGTSLHIANAARAARYPLSVIHIPKTVDNDMALTDFSPGFGSVAKFTAVSVREAAQDLAAMARTSTKVFVMEVMGRHSGWIAASAALAQSRDCPAPQIILFPEVKFDRTRFLQQVEAVVQRDGYCVVVVAEGALLEEGKTAMNSDSEHGRDLWHVQAGHAAPQVATLIKNELGLPCHFSISDYLQRSARHLASSVDSEAAWRVGTEAVALTLRGEDRVMAALKRKTAPTQSKARWTVEPVALTRVAGKEKNLPRHFIQRDGFSVSSSGLRWLQALITGEDYPEFSGGLPLHAPALGKPLARKLPLYNSGS
ncbi:MAG: 6-phosphofructokinase [Pedobacter sp.]|nr:6-phosphofructokinase [Pedobacter sp.]